MKLRFSIACLTCLFSAASFANDQGPTNEKKWEFDAGIYAMYDSQSFEGDIFTEEGITDTSVDYLRRVKASADVKYDDQWTLEVALEYRDKDQTTQVDDFNLNYQINSNVEFTIGKFKEPLGLENQLSLRYQPMLERSTPTNVLLFGRNSGIGFDIEHKKWTLDLAMIYLEAPSNLHRDSLAHIARFTYAPLQKKKRFVHFGLDFSSRQGTVDVYDINEPLIAAGVGNLIRTPNFNADVIKLTGIEFAVRYKPILFQTEYFEQRIKQPSLPDQTLHGYYMMATYTLMGNSRTYKHGKLKFPDKKDHTVELAVRLSETKLTPVFRGDDATVTTVALNYFYKKYARLSLEFQDAEFTHNGNSNSTDLEGQSVNTRLQLAF